jgi:hypothetical protein
MRSGGDQPRDGFEFELKHLVTSQGWAIFSLEEPKRGARFLGLTIGAAHPRVATEAWRRRPALVFDVGEWILDASLEAPAAARHVGALAARIAVREEPGERGFLGKLTTLWNQAAERGQVETRSFTFLHSFSSIF